MNWNKRRNLPLAVAALAILGGCGSKNTTEIVDNGVELRRTSFGVPHIKAANETGLGMGIGYAYAQDNFCMMADIMVTNAGERSKYFGPTATYSMHGRADDTIENLASDFYYKHLNEPSIVQAALLSQPAEVRALITGYVQGFNKYLTDSGVANLPAECKGKPWVRAMIPEDMIRLTRSLAVLNSGGVSVLLPGFSTASPPAGSTSVASAASPRGASLVASVAAAFSRKSTLAFSTERMAPDLKKVKSDFGSNGVALGKDATESGAGLLYANPHFPWQGKARFYQSHLTIPGKVDVMGASLAGLPVVMIGFNENIAWTHTSNNAPRFIMYQLALDPSDPTKYMMDGKSKSMTKKEIAVETTTNGVTATVKRTFYYSEQGPMMDLPRLNMTWSRATAFAMTDINFNNNRMLTQWWEMNKASSLASLKAAQVAIIGTPWVHTIATDRQGQTYFGDINPVPYLTDAQLTQCMPAGYKPYVASGVYVLTGDTSACALGTDPAAPQPGIFSGARLPTLSRSDYVQNSNDSPWYTNPAQPLNTEAAIMGPNGGPLTGRTRLGITQIQDRLAGTDGLPGRKFTIANLQQIVMSNEAYFARMLLSDLREACAAPTSDISKGCAVMVAWDGKANLDSVGFPLFQNWLAEMDRTGMNYAKIAADPLRPRLLGLDLPGAAATGEVHGPWVDQVG